MAAPTLASLYLDLIYLKDLEYSKLKQAYAICENENQMKKIMDDIVEVLKKKNKYFDIVEKCNQ